MNKRQLTIEHNGKILYGQIATIDRTAFGQEDHGIMTATLHCKWHGGGIGVGGFGLDTPERDENDTFIGRIGSAYGLDHIMRILETVGVERWEQLPGQKIVVLFESANSWGSTSVGIASLLDEDKVFILKDHAEAWKERVA